jgi:hypothetical protein
VRRNIALIVATAAAAGIALVAGAATVAAAVASPAAARAGHWGTARQLAGLDKLNTGGDAAVTWISCTPGSPGNCTASGRYSVGTADRAFVVDEQAGHWGTATPTPVPDPAATASDINSLSCDAPRSCVAGGRYSLDGTNFKGFFAVEDNGKWDSATAVSGSDTHSTVNSVSCPSAGDCEIGGYIDSGGGPMAFVMAERGGVWGPVQPVTGLSALGASAGSVTGLSCARSGECAAVGQYTDAASKIQTFVVEESRGGWGTAHPVPEMSMLKATSSFPGSLSCRSPGNCTLGGTYTDDHDRQQVFTADEDTGSWGPPQQVPGTETLNALGDARVNQVSCASPGNCAAAGYYTDRDANRRAYVAEEKRGTWQAVRTLAGAGPLANGSVSDALAVSCPAPANCVASGWFNDTGDNGPQAFTVSEVNGTWGMAQAVPGSVALNKGEIATTNAVSCAAPGNCAAGGSYVDSSDVEPAFLADSSTATASTLALSAGKVRFGHEQAEKIFVKVTSRTGGTPRGTVTVKANTANACVITLSGGRGSCTLPARKLRPGRYRLTAIYGGSQTYAGSASSPKTVTVTK